MQVTDPVCGMTIDSEKAAAREGLEGTDLLFLLRVLSAEVPGSAGAICDKRSRPLGGLAQPLMRSGCRRLLEGQIYRRP
jgi:hypothetical protein